MDFTLLNLLLDFAAEKAADGVSKLTYLAGLTSLEMILLAGYPVLAGTIAALFKWGNGIRSTNAGIHEKRNDLITKLVTDQTADNKDIIHALQDMNKAMERLVVKSDTSAIATSVVGLKEEQTRMTAAITALTQQLGAQR